MALSVGDPAPKFEARDQNNNVHRLSDYRGKWIILYFYPKDNTPGCTKEACGMRDHFDILTKRAAVFGVSADSVISHKRFAQKYHLQFPLLADPAKTIITAYGTDNVLFRKRTTFIIGPEGKIVKIYSKVLPDQHAQDLLKDLEVLQS